MALFAAGSLIVALSPAFLLLLFGRAVQGLGAGGVFPVASAVIGDLFPPEKRGSALGLIGAVFGIAFLVGPIIQRRGAILSNLALALYHQPAHCRDRDHDGTARVATDAECPATRV